MSADKIRLSDYGKLAVMLAVIVSVTLLALTDKVPGTACLAAVVGVLGYVAGNGVTAIRRQPPSPVVGNREVLGQLSAMRKPSKRSKPKPKRPPAEPTTPPADTPPDPAA